VTVHNTRMPSLIHEPISLVLDCFTKFVGDTTVVFERLTLMLTGTAHAQVGTRFPESTSVLISRLIEVSRSINLSVISICCFLSVTTFRPTD